MENVQYCTKAESRVAGPWTVGDMSGDPDAVDRAEDALDVVSVSDNYDDLPPKWRFITVCWGPPAIGKTRVWNLIGEYVGGGVYHVPGKAKNSSGRWVGTYNGEQTAIIDEFDYDNDFEQSQWKLILDRRPQMVPASMGGKSVLWKPQIIVLLSNHAIGPGHPFTADVFTTRFSEEFNDWNWISDSVGGLYPRLACPLYHRPIQLHRTIDLYPRYIPPDERKRGKGKRSASRAALDDGGVVQSRSVGHNATGEPLRIGGFAHSQRQAAPAAAQPVAAARASSSSMQSRASAAEDSQPEVIDIDSFEAELWQL